GLSVALLGGGTALGILLAAVLFSILKIGGLGMQTIAGIPYEIVSIVIAAIIFFVAIQYVIGRLFKNKQTAKSAGESTDAAAAETAAGPKTSEGGQG
ncbi:ABC transporter permease, partial [Lactobacillus sp. XV13L]|nr:ABC transporter permease [Lactobacillus sp. XV13L]